MCYCFNIYECSAKLLRPIDHTEKKINQIDSPSFAKWTGSSWSCKEMGMAINIHDM